MRRINPTAAFLRIFARSSHSWRPPSGHDTGIKVFNCAAKSKQALIVRDRNLVTWYTCGPTVYAPAHLGHASCYVKLDVIQRILRAHFHLNLVTVMNITDIDDKLIASSHEHKTTVAELATRYERDFFADLHRLGVPKPNCVMRVSENIPLITDFIRKLVDAGKAYKSADNSVYFDVEKAANYGKLQNLAEENPEPSIYKKSSRDFALWKASKPGEPAWASPWGGGRPGWHVECSALASHIFGSTVDIHAGGIDLRFPHHENEEAQCCALHKTNQWVNYWLHTGHLRLKGDAKMSKSLKNAVSIAAMLGEHDSNVFRMACLMSHYQSGIDYTPEFMATATNYLKNYRNFADNVRNYANGVIHAKIDDLALIKRLVEVSFDVDMALKDDFNTPAVVNTLNEFISFVNAMLHRSGTGFESRSAAVLASGSLVGSVLELFGVNLGGKKGESFNDAEVINVLVDFRQEIRQLGIERKDKNLLELCDSVRERLQKSGISVKDHGKVSSWS